MRKTKGVLLAGLLMCTAMFAGCGEDPLKAGKTTVVFWGYADADEAATVAEITDWYNKNNTDNIYIDYAGKPGDSYDSVIDRALAGAKGPDVFYVGDRYLKRWAKIGGGYLENLQPYVDESDIDLEGMWDSAVQRYRYNPEKNTNNPDDPLYALPKDISPTALFYNVDVMKKQGIKVISLDEQDIAAFNKGEKADNYGKYKSDYGIDIDVQAKGFYRDQPYKHGLWKQPVYSGGKVVETMIFNNRIAMSWDETEDLAMILTREYNNKLSGSDTKWGYYTEWWFNYCWGVGGDCAVDTTGEGDWKFTLGDTSKKSVLYNADGSYAYGADGKNIFVAESEQASYKKEEGQYFGEPLPSTREAFERFLMLGKPKSAGGLAVAPRQTADIGLQSSTAFFSTGKVAMLVQSNYCISSFRKAITDFEWDVAPLPVYKEYESDGVTVKNKGVEIGHSGSSGLGIWKKSRQKEAAFKVAEYLSGGEAQRIQARNGFLMPNNRVLAAQDYVKYNLESGKAPKNIQVFTEYGDVQRPGDWWYMPDNAWIDEWATPLNTQYRENNKTLDEFFAAYTNATNAILAGYKQNGMI